MSKTKILVISLLVVSSIAAATEKSYADCGDGPDCTGGKICLMGSCVLNNSGPSVGTPSPDSTPKTTPATTDTASDNESYDVVSDCVGKKAGDDCEVMSGHWYAKNPDGVCENNAGSMVCRDTETNEDEELFTGGTPSSDPNKLFTDGKPPKGEYVMNGLYIPTADETGLSDRPIRDILMNLLEWMLEIVGVIALIGFVISGIQYILAAGDEKLAETAKGNMKYSIMGIVVVLASLVIVQAVDFALRGYGRF